MEERAMLHTERPRFGIATAPQQVSYEDVRRVWREADAIPEIEHAWLFDHLLPIGEDEPFDFDGSYIQLTGAFCNPKPVQRPSPPFMIGGRTTATLRVVAEHADLWNIPGSDLDDCIERGARLDRICGEIGRDPAAITRSIHLRVAYDDPDTTRDHIRNAIDAGFGHIVLGLPAPYPENVARWVTDELISART
jgi:Luciferase-like monooxygenase